MNEADKKDDLKEMAIKEIESVLWKLGASGGSGMFPDFEVVNSDLDYGIQRDGDDILIETKLTQCSTKKRLLIRLKIEKEYW